MELTDFRPVERSSTSFQTQKKFHIQLKKGLLVKPPLFRHIPRFCDYAAKTKQVADESPGSIVSTGTMNFEEGMVILDVSLSSRKI